MNRFHLAFFTVILGIGLIFGGIPAAYAQEKASEEFILEEIIVTAEKRIENAQKVAMPIETVTGDTITEMGMTTLREALANIAGVSVQKQGHELTVVIRGMDDDSRPGSSQAMVGVTVDGTYSNLMSTGKSGLFDVQRIEVLTGPQGTLYSRNAAGGIVNMITNNPNTEKFDASVSGEMGNFNLINTTGMVNIPISEKLAVRSAFQITNRDGFTSNGTNDNNIKSMRLKLGYNHSENLSTIFGLEYSAIRGHGAGSGTDPWETPPENPWKSSTPGTLNTEHRDIWKGYMDLKWNTPIGEIVFLPSFGRAESEQEFEPMKYTDSNNVISWALGGHHDIERERSVELRLGSNEEAFVKYIIGVYYYTKNRYKGMYTLSCFYDETNPDGNMAIVRPPSSRVVDVINNAAFGNITYPLTDAFRLSAGGRYTSDKEEIEIYNPVPRRPGDPTYSLNNYPSSHFDYKLGFEYDLNENIMLWGDYATGYKHITESATPQDLISYQIGEKGRFFDQKVQLNVTAWYYDYENFDVQTSKTYIFSGVEESDPGTGLGDAILYGLDVSSNYLPTYKDLIHVTLAYMHSEISDMLITYRYYYPPDRVLEGLPLNNSPEWSINVSYEHIFSLNNGGSLTPKVNTLYQTEKMCTFFPESFAFPGINLDIANWEPAHHISGASLLYSEPHDKWNINAYVKNIENHPEKVSLHGMYFRIGEPRTYGISVSVKF